MEYEFVENKKTKQEYQFKGPFLCPLEGATPLFP
jgi:hypothetical protein